LEDARDQWATTVEKLRESEGKQMYASQQWQATVELMQAADAGLTDTREQWARTLEQLHESEAKQFYVTQQWQLTAERVRAAESGLEDARAEWADTVERLRDSEAKQLYASEQWRLTAERFREAEVQLKQLRLQHQSLGQQFTETDVRLQAELHIRQEREAVLSQTLDQLRRQTVETERARERLGELEKQHEEAVESMCLLEEKHQLLIAEHGELAYHQDRLLTRVRGLECRQRWAIGGVVIVFLTAIAGFFLRLI
jgi:alpha-D-ribose 1-methylphosphonate 5-triphosphate synthase subunit PhnG